jgi:ABC-type transport system involved in multi-copper enzyme maturation permease subunit
MMGLDAFRIRAVIRKELRDYRRKRSIVVTVSILPCIFLINPALTIFLTSASAASSPLDKTVSISLIFFLVIPVIMPSTLAAYSVVGEREQGIPLRIGS